MGKSFRVDDKLIKKIESIQGVKIVTEVIEDYGIARYNDALGCNHKRGQP
jgi:hypothetical protein